MANSNKIKLTLKKHEIEGSRDWIVYQILYSTDKMKFKIDGKKYTIGGLI